VQRVIPEYNNGNAGYHYVLDTTKLSDGNHKITVRETGNSGKITTLSEVSVRVLNTIGYMDTPAAGQMLKGSTNVSGWFLDGGGVSKIEVLVDGNPVGQAVYGDARPDVQRVIPEYNNGNAGYHYVLDTTKLSDGNHKITVKETGNKGNTTLLSEVTVIILNHT
jgi:N-acetylmuramoyl-L-alanine amidase